MPSIFTLQHAISPKSKYYPCVATWIWAAETLITSSCKTMYGTAGAVQSECLATIYEQQFPNSPAVGGCGRDPQVVGNVLTSQNLLHFWHSWVVECLVSTGKTKFQFSLDCEWKFDPPPNKNREKKRKKIFNVRCPADTTSEKQSLVIPLHYSQQRNKNMHRAHTYSYRS